MLLILLICLPVLFTSCKKEFEVPLEQKELDVNREMFNIPVHDFSDIPDKLIDFEACDGYKPIGGAQGYNNIITSGSIIIKAYDTGILKTPQQLFNELHFAVTNAPTNAIIFIEPDCQIEIKTSIIVNKKITIASSRGLNGSAGAVLYPHPSLLGINNFMIIIQSNDVHISGITFKGLKDDTYAIQAIDVRNIEIDNCDIYFWTIGISISETAIPPSNENMTLDDNAFKIHNNYIHDNYFKEGENNIGYGIVIGNAMPKIFANVFNYNRHDIAGAGWMKSGYEANCNIFLSSSHHDQSNLDMHDCQSCPVNTISSSIHSSGCFMHIHHNEFRAINNQANIYPFGKPTTLCLIDNNIFCTQTIFDKPNSNSPAISQWPDQNLLSFNGFGNIVCLNNIYNNQDYLGWYVRETWDNNKTDNVFRIPSSNDILLSMNNPTLPMFTNIFLGLPQYLDFEFGDFNGDGITDILKIESNQFYYLPLNTGYVDHWISLGSVFQNLASVQQQPNDNYLIYPNLILGNFDSDAKTDILETTGTEWKVSYGAQSNFINYVFSTYTSSDLLFGKFSNSGNNDFITDAFVKDNNDWKISYDGNGWQSVNYSTYPFSSLKVGDFNGDLKKDILCSSGSEWLVSNNATSSWNILNTSNLDPADIVLGDINSDNISDVIGIWNNKWWISISGTASWANINTSNFPLSQFEYGNLK